MNEINPRNIPEEKTERDQWLFWNASNDTPRAPLDSPSASYGCSWSDPDTWLSFDEVVEKAQQVPEAGIGYVNAADNDDYARGLYGVVDLDGVADEDGRPKDWVPSLQPFFDRDAYAEWSPSGEGIHIPIVGIDVPDWWSDQHFSDEEHEGIEVLTNKFATVTGDVMRGCENADVVEYGEWFDDWLREAYKAVTGEDPLESRQAEIADGVTDDGRETPDEEWFTEDVAEDALEHIDPDEGYSVWRDVGMALTNKFGSRGERMFEQWSRRGSKWDSEAERQAKRICRDASNYQYDAGTIIHFAKAGGWNASAAAADVLSTRSDGGHTATARESTSNAATPSGASEPSANGQASTDGKTAASGTWDDIRGRLRAAEKSEHRAGPRFDAAMKLLDDHSFATLAANDQLYAYDKSTGIYNDDGESIVRSELTQHLEEQYRAHGMSEALDHIRGRTIVTDEEMGGPAGMIAAQNCVIDLSEGVAREHDPKYRFLSRLGCEFDPDADAARFRAFLNEVVPKDSERKKLQEYAGYTLMHWGLPYHKALFLVGPTASGKSTFLDTISAMLGDETVASLTPQQLTGERFAGAELFGKWANIRNDIPAETVENTGEFKEITAGDQIKAERKRKDPFWFEPHAKHMYAANELPSTETDDEAFYRRILLAPFPETIPEPERDKHLDDKLVAELPGVLNWALEGLERLQANGGFTGDRRPGHTQDTWQKWSDSVSRFADAAIDDGKEDIAKSELYAAYLEYCRQEGIPSDTQHSMTRGLKQEGMTDGRSYVDGEQLRVFHNVSLTGRGKQLIEDAKSDGESGSEADDRRATGLSGWDE